MINIKTCIRYFSFPALLCCNEPNGKIDVKVDSIAKNEKNGFRIVDSIPSINRTAGLNDLILPKKVLGKWAIVGTKKAVLIIRKGEIFYIDISKTLKYKISKDRITYSLPEGNEGTDQLTMKGNDTLILKNNQEIQTYYRME